MRLIRNVRGLADSTQQFGHHQIIKTSSEILNQVLFDAYAAQWSKIQCRGRSSTASLPSDTVEVKNSQRKISMDERRVMLEKYVESHKGMNGGKFPSITNARKNVGGSFYFIRKILQELEYNSKISHSNINYANSLDKSTKEKIEASVDLQVLSCNTSYPTSVDISTRKKTEASIDLQAVSERRELGEITSNFKPAEDHQRSFDTLSGAKAGERLEVLTVDSELLNSEADRINNGGETNEWILKKRKNVKKSLTAAKENVIKDEPISRGSADNSSRKTFELQEGPEASVSFEKDDSKDTGTQSHTLDDGLKASHGGAMHVEEMKSESSLKFDTLKPNDNKHPTNSEVTGRELHRIPDKDAEPESISSLWQNLKSFTKGIFGMWRRP